jgi:tetratricopeptide (TPR) repeat protein
MPVPSFKTVLTAACLFIGSIDLIAQPVTLPRTPSPAATVSQTVGISTITINYSRPSVKGRNVWGGLVPYGWNKQAFGPGLPAPWRAGANENTVLTLSQDATIEGHRVPAGSYGLFFVINQNNTGELILSKDHRSWGSFFYNEALDEMRANIRLRDIPMTEMLTYAFENNTKTSSELELNWEKKQFPVKIEFAVDSIVMANAEQELRNTAGFTPQGYISASNYALQNKINYEEALTWIDKAIAQTKNFTALNIKAGLLQATGKTAEADAIMKEATAVANEIELNQYGYQLLGNGDQDRAIGIFILNTQRNPKSANAWDSLGEGYSIKGDKKNAITSFKKSLSLNPPNNVRLNSEKYLKQLGAL